MPDTPELRLTLKKGKPPVATVRVDPSKPVEFVDVFYTQHGQVDGEKNDATNTKNRFWHHASIPLGKGKSAAHIHLPSVDKPLWVYANVRYKLENPVRSRLLLWIIHGEFLQLVLFDENRFVFRIEKGGGRFHPQAKLADRRFQGRLEKGVVYLQTGQVGNQDSQALFPVWSPPENGGLSFEVRSQMENKLIVGMDGYATEACLAG